MSDRFWTRWHPGIVCILAYIAASGVGFMFHSVLAGFVAFLITAILGYNHFIFFYLNKKYPKD